MKLSRDNFKIISGGQTGVDRAALDVAIAFGIDHGGWCPKGRRAEDGVISLQYNLQETGSVGYLVRTLRNVADSTATLVLCWGGTLKGGLVGGTGRTVQACRAQRKTCHVVDLTSHNPGSYSSDWVLAVAREEYDDLHPFVLNVAGPRQSRHPRVYGEARGFLTRMLDRLGLIA